MVGANGSGKTTLLRILANELEPDSGRIESADGLKVVYFDQRLQKLDLDQTLRQALALMVMLSVIEALRCIFPAGPSDFCFARTN